MDKQELKILQILDAIIRQESVRAVIDSLILRVERTLSQDVLLSLSWEPVPLATYGEIPIVIHSSWVFAIPAQAKTGAERHPNSHQRMMSYKGSGDLLIWTGEKWHSNHLMSNLNARIENRWISILPNTWHQAVVTKENWVVISFHTVPEDELIEERPDATNAGLIHQRTYLHARK